MFYAVSIHEFFLHHRIKIQQPPPFFYLQPPQITDHSFFFYGRINHRSAAGATTTAMAGVGSGAGRRAGRGRRGELAGRRRWRGWSPVRKREGEIHRKTPCVFFSITHVRSIAFLNFNRFWLATLYSRQFGLSII